MKEIVNKLKTLESIQKILETGDIYIVGGCVRDWLLGETSKDIDLLITGFTYEELKEILHKSGSIDLVGSSFSVIKWKPYNLDLGEIDVAIPRIDKKTGQGHRDFEVISGPEISVEEDLSRRDFTINSIAYKFDNTIFDPYYGIQDLIRNALVATNPEVFHDDGLRIVRGVRFAAKFNFTISAEFQNHIINNLTTLNTISAERFLIEFEYAYKQCDHKLYLHFLNQLQISKYLFGQNSKYHGSGTIEDFLWDLGIRSTDSGPVKFKLPNNYLNWIKTLEKLNELHDEITVGSSFEKILLHLLILANEPRIIDSARLTHYAQSLINIANDYDIPLFIKGLNINGNDLLEAGYIGKAIKTALNFILAKQIQDLKVYTKEESLQLIHEYFDTRTE